MRVSFEERKTKKKTIKELFGGFRNSLFHACKQNVYTCNVAYIFFFLNIRELILENIELQCREFFYNRIVTGRGRNPGLIENEEQFGEGCDEGFF